MKDSAVDEDDDGIRLDRWFKRHCPGVTHGLLEKSLRKGMVRVEGKKADASARVTAGQQLRFPEEWLAMKPPESSQKAHKTRDQVADLRSVRDMVLFENEHVLILNKPAGLSVQGGTKQEEHLDIMLNAVRNGRGERPRLVHRLDKDTSGVLMLAKSAKAAAELARQLKEKTIEKIYCALVIGVPKPREGVIDLPIAKQEGDREKMDVDEAEGKRAITEYRVAEALGKQLAWMELRPVTGRTHQLRVHMNAIGHPIVGDGKYGGAKARVEGLELPRQLHLHAERIIIESLFGKRIDVRAKLPPHMLLSKKTLGG